MPKWRKSPDVIKIIEHIVIWIKKIREFINTTNYLYFAEEFTWNPTLVHKNWIDRMIIFIKVKERRTLQLVALTLLHNQHFTAHFITLHEILAINLLAALMNHYFQYCVTTFMILRRYNCFLIDLISLVGHIASLYINYSFLLGQMQLVSRRNWIARFAFGV